MVDLRESGSKVVDYLKKPARFIKTALSTEDINRRLTYGTIGWGLIGTGVSLNELVEGIGSLNPYRIAMGLFSGAGTYFGAKHFYGEMEKINSDYEKVEEMLGDDNDYYGLFKAVENEVMESEGLGEVFSTKLKDDEWVDWMLTLAEVHVKRHSKQKLRRRFEKARLKWLEETEPEDSPKIARAKKGMRPDSTIESLLNQ